MALEGSLTDFGLADILQLIYFQRKTGVLTLEGKMDKVRLIFVDGNISVAESKRRTDDNRLGKILLKKGLISEEDLHSVLEEQKKTGARFASILMKKDLVENDVIKEILQSQITETVIQIFGWKQGSYEFSSQGVGPEKELAFSIDTQHLLMEGLRIVDEWSLIKGKITIDTVFARRDGSPSGLTAEESEIFSYVDGENDVSTIIDLSGKDNFHVSKTLLGMMEKGMIEAVSAAPVAAEEAPAGRKKTALLAPVLLPILLAIAAVVSFSVFFTTRDAPYRIMEAADRVEDLRFRVEAYRMKHAAYPENVSQLGDANDPWGRPFVYKVSEGSFSISSSGPDGLEGTDDDIY